MRLPNQKQVNSETEFSHVHLTLEHMRPLPKATLGNNEKKTREVGQSRIYTDALEKNGLEEKE